MTGPVSDESARTSWLLAIALSQHLAGRHGRSLRKSRPILERDVHLLILSYQLRALASNLFLAFSLSTFKHTPSHRNGDLSMQENTHEVVDLAPNILLTSPTFNDSRDGRHAGTPASPSRPRKRRFSKHVHITEPESGVSSRDGSSIYLGSYRNSPRRSRESVVGPASDSPHGKGSPSPRSSISHLQLQHLLVGVDVELETYDVEELRDGFFDASFYRPVKRDPVIMSRRASETLPLSLMPHERLPFLKSSQEQALLLVKTVKGILTSRSGIKLCKSFLGFFISYVLCLLPVTKAWLGKYSYIMVVSTIINHPGRSIGSQIDGAVMTTLGTLAGLLWGTLATYVAIWSSTGDSGYGGLIALFLIIFSAVLGWLRCFFLRLYQAILCAGIAICYACLADTFDGIGWIRLTQYIVPWILGQAVALMVSVVIFPAAGTRPIA